MSTKPQLSGRLEFVDALRGLAVLSMMVLHTAHGWLRPELRSGDAWYWINSVGGMAAPLFFLLAGVGHGLRGTSRGTRRELARGLSLVLLGYLLRVQMWQVDGAALVDPAQLAPGLVLAGGYGLLLIGVQRWGERLPAPRWATWGGPPACLLGILWSTRVAGPNLPNLFRFDVLQGLGFATLLVTAASAVATTERARVLACTGLGAGVLAATPWLRAWVPGPLPAPLAAPIAYWPSTDGVTWAMFPMFPWAAYTALGVVVGVALRVSHARGVRPAGMLLPWAVLGLGLAYLTNEALPRVSDWLNAIPELTQPVRVGYRLGIGLVLLAVTAALTRAAPVAWPLVQLGRASLWVYWVHLEFAFGAPSTPVHGRLGHGAWAVLLVLLTVAMLGLAHLRIRYRRWVMHGLHDASPSAVTKVHQGA